MNCVRMSRNLRKASSLVPGTRQELSHGQLEVAGASAKERGDNVPRREGAVAATDVTETFSPLCSDAPFIMVMDSFTFKVHSTDKEK